jgi:hypothetical protein
VPAGAVGDPLHGGSVGRGKFGGDMGAQPLLVACGPRGVQGLDHRGGHALIEHAAQEFPAGREPGRAVEHLDLGTEGPEDGGVTHGAGSAGQHRDAQAAPGHRGHHGHVSERDACLSGQVGQLPFSARRSRVQIGPQDVRPRALVLAQAGQSGQERVDRGLRAVDAQHQVGSAGGLGFAGGVEDGFGRGYRRIVAADTHPRGDQVTRDERAGLPQAEDRDDQRVSVPAHHTRG